MFKSPSKVMQGKKGTINFIKTVTSPNNSRQLQIQTAKNINTLDNDLSIDQFNK